MVSIWHKQWQIYFLPGKSIKNGCNNLYLQSNTFNMNSKSFSCLVSPSCRGPVNPSTPTFGNINLTETMTNLLLNWNLIKSDCNNLYLHNKSFKTTLKPYSYQRSIFRRGPVNPSTPTFPISILQKQWKIVCSLENHWKRL